MSYIVKSRYFVITNLTLLYSFKLNEVLHVYAIEVSTFPGFRINRIYVIEFGEGIQQLIPPPGGLTEHKKLL